MIRWLTCPLLGLLLSACSHGGDCGDLATRPAVPDWDPTTVDPPYDAATNPFDQPIGTNPTLHADSDVLVTSLEQQLDAQGMVVVVSEWSTPVYLADASTPRVDVALTAGWAPYSLMKDVPMPPWALPDPEGDGHLAVLELDEGLEYDFHVFCGAESDTQANWGNIVSLDGPGIFPNGLSARGSGFALLNGVIWPHELEAGHIDHALLFSFDNTRSGGPVAPATESDGTGNGDPNLPEGARLQLDPDLDVSTLGLAPWQETIAVALQEYGMILGDDGGGISLYAIGPRSFEEGEAVYDGLIDLDGPLAHFPEDFPVDRFRVLDYGPQDPDASDSAAVEFSDRFE